MECIHCGRKIRERGVELHIFINYINEKGSPVRLESYTGILCERCIERLYGAIRELKIRKVYG